MAAEWRWKAAVAQATASRPGSCGRALEGGSERARRCRLVSHTVSAPSRRRGQRDDAFRAQRRSCGGGRQSEDLATGVCCHQSTVRQWDPSWYDVCDVKAPGHQLRTATAGGRISTTPRTTSRRSGDSALVKVRGRRPSAPGAGTSARAASFAGGAASRLRIRGAIASSV